MIPGEYQILPGTIAINVGRETQTVIVENHGDRPIQVGSHYHFYEVNPALKFDREATRGYRLNIPAGTAVRFEPGPHTLAAVSDNLPRCGHPPALPAGETLLPSANGFPLPAPLSLSRCRPKAPYDHSLISS